MGTKNSNVKPKSKSQWKELVFLLFAVVIFLVILVSTVFNDVVQIYNNKKQTEQLEIRYNELLEEEASLNSEVVKLQDPDYQARYAREKYLYTKDGEKILTIIENDN
jgi:cell division protein DivIC